jgi:hypothetical protein
MPNWCYNTIRVRGPQRELDKFEKHLNDTDGKDWFSYFVKPGRELTDGEWYGWNLENYGCKWNCDANDWRRDDEETISFTFDSPWGPPIALYENIENMELESESGYIDYFRVDAEYLEEGMQFMGRFIDGENEYYEYSDLDSLDNIPDETETVSMTEDELAQALEELKAEFDKIMDEENQSSNNSTDNEEDTKNELRNTLK